jgi:hypothetical protein
MTSDLGDTVLRPAWLVAGTIVTVAALWVGLAAMQGARGQTAAPPRLSGGNRFETAWLCRVTGFPTERPGRTRRGRTCAPTP